MSSAARAAPAAAPAVAKASECLSPRIRGVVFDMDGTLTRHGAIDFARMRERLGLKPGDGLLEHLHSLQGDEFKEANRVIEDEEAIGLDRCELQRGILDILKYLEDKGIPRALLTRNSAHGVDHFLRKLPPSLGDRSQIFSVLLSREFEGGFKPSPAPLQHIAERWNLETKHLLMVGDMADDINCGTNASARTCLMKHHDNTHLSEANAADFQVGDLKELVEVIQRINNSDEC